MSRAGRQAGAVLFVALVMLTMLMLGASALMRMIDVGTLLAGNLAFKRAATLATDAGAEAAVGWLQAQAASALYADQPQQGYYASDAAGLDVSGNRSSPAARIDWDGNQCGNAAGIHCRQPAPALASDAAGHQVRYLVQRLCRLAGDPQAGANDCHIQPALESGASRGSFSYGEDKRFAGTPAVYYRITVRALGPRNTVSYAEALVRY
jgi:hypothetical protein